MHLSRSPVNPRDGGSGEVKLKDFSGLMVDGKRQVLALRPLAEQDTKLGVAVTVIDTSSIRFPEQLAGYSLLFQLLDPTIVVLVEVSEPFGFLVFGRGAGVENPP
jgi:hypothetical protein